MPSRNLTLVEWMIGIAITAVLAAVLLMVDL
jgi:Tfp pilus assembly protein PilE